MRPLVTISFILIFIMTSGCGQKKDDAQTLPPAPSSLTLADLTGFMTGSFSSAQQAVSDSEFFDIRLEMWPIWLYRSDAHWLYVEQAAASHLSRPYRQRVYRVYQTDDTTFISEVYEIPEPERFSNQWREDMPLAELTADSLIARPGCAIILHPEGDSVFVGSTVDAQCTSDHNDASWATSEVRIAKDYLFSWDRGWGADSLQVWGAVTGGYIFKKIKNTKE